MRQSRYDTTKQTILSSIASYQEREGRAPSVRELAEAAVVGVATAHSYLGKLSREGLVEWREKSHRTLRLTPEGLEVARRSLETLRS